MYNVSDDFLAAIKAYERTLRCSLIIGNNEVEYLNRLEISQSISSSDFEIGNVIAAQMNAEISNFEGEYSGIFFKNQKAEMRFTLELEDGTEETIPLGVFKIDTVDTEDNIISISGYDAVAQTDVDYIPADIYPNTVRAVAMDIAAVCELELSDDAFINDSLTIESMPEWGDITCRTALGYIAELAGGCWIADRQGKLKLIGYKAPAYEVNPSDYYSLKVAESDFAGINTLYIISDDKELAWSVNGECEYTIANNPLFNNKDFAGEAIVNLEEAMINTDYRPYELEYSCNPALDLGDGISITDIKGNTYTSVIFDKTISYDGGLSGTLAAYADLSEASKGSCGQTMGEQLKTTQKTATDAKATAETAQKTAEEVKTTLDNLPEIGVTIVNQNVIKSETMQSIWCFARYMLVQFMETNFDALDITKTYKQLRKYIRIFDDNIKVIEAELSDSETEDYTDPNGQKLYWTAVTGANAHKFFTYTSPLTIAASERPEGLTDAEFENLYTVKVRKTTAEYVKCSLGFPLNSSGTGEPELVFGTGDANGNGKYCFVKDNDSGRFIYYSRFDGKERGIKLIDDGAYYSNDGENWLKMGAGLGGNIKIIDHEPTEADLTGENTVFVRYDNTSTPVLSGSIGILHNAANVYVETPTVQDITINPTAVTLYSGDTQQFNCNIDNVTWFVSGAASANTKISSEGLLTVGVDETAASITVKVISNINSNRFTIATVAVIAAVDTGKLYLFNNGLTDASGGIAAQYYQSANAVPFEFGATIMRNRSSAQSTTTIAYFANKFDLTNYETLKIHIVSSTAVTGNGYNYLGYAATTTIAANTDYNYQSIITGNDYTLSFNISSITGILYLALGATNGNVNIDKIWLE